MDTPFILFIIAGIGIVLTAVFYGSEQAMDDPLHFLFHGWGIVIIIRAYIYRKKLKWYAKQEL